MVQTPDNQPHQSGINKVKEVLQKRLNRIDSNRSIVDIFEQPEALDIGLIFVRCSPAEGEKLIVKAKEDIPKRKIEVCCIN